MLNIGQPQDFLKNTAGGIFNDSLLSPPPKDLSQSAQHDIIYKYSLAYARLPINLVLGDVTEFTFFLYTKDNKQLKTNDRALGSSWTNNQRINSIDNHVLQANKKIK